MEVLLNEKMDLMEGGRLKNFARNNAKADKY